MFWPPDTHSVPHYHSWYVLMHQCTFWRGRKSWYFSFLEVLSSNLIKIGCVCKSSSMACAGSSIMVEMDVTDEVATEGAFSS